MSAIREYIRGFVRPDHPQLDEILWEESVRENVQPGIGPEVGKLLGLLCRLMAAKRVLELGTSLGYSTIWLAQAVCETGGRLTSVEMDGALLERTGEHLTRAGLTGCVDLVHGDARELLRVLTPPFDLILQDADKALYPEMLDDCVRLLRPGGVLVADDALFVPMGVSARLSEPIHTYNQRVFAEPRLYSTILPIGDGVTVSIKRR